MGSKGKKAVIDDTEKQYEVEEILNKRKRKGKTEYLIKWVGYPSSSNSWEPTDNIDPELIASFEGIDDEKATKKSEPSAKHSVDKQSAVYDSPEKHHTMKNGETSDGSDTDDSATYCYKFEEGFTAEKVLGAKLENDEVYFLFRYENSDEGEYVPSKIANVKFPQLVIEFYEGITLWGD